jgi:hypothetical protein
MFFQLQGHQYIRQNLLNHLNSAGEIKPTIMELNSESTTENGVHADYWSQHLVDNWNKSETLYSLLEQNPTLNKFSGSGSPAFFKIISQMIRAHKDRKVNRDVFFVRLGGLDAHTDVSGNLRTNIEDVNNAFKEFRSEMKAQDNYDKVTVLMQSEFGRTITPNTSDGTDHAWGGNYFMFGGGVNGGRILGEYPGTFWDTDPTNIGRGRLIPTTSWDSWWFGIFQWYGVETDEDMKYILPNHGSFGCFLLSEQVLYRNGTGRISGCDGVSLNFDVTSVLSEPRYLTSLEEKKVCDSVLAIAEMETGQTARCIVVGQQIFVNISRRLIDGMIQDTTMSLKQYLNRDGSRTLTGESVTYSVKIDTSVSYVPVQSDSSDPLNVPDLTQKFTDQLGRDLKRFIQNMTSLESVAVTTSSPTLSSVPSLMPTISSAPSAKHFPSKAPSSIASSIPSISNLPTMNPTTVHPTTSPSVTVPSEIQPFTYVVFMTTSFEAFTESQIEVFCDSIIDALHAWEEEGGVLFCTFYGQTQGRNRNLLDFSIKLASWDSALLESFSVRWARVIARTPFKEDLANKLKDAGVDNLDRIDIRGADENHPMYHVNI